MKKLVFCKTKVDKANIKRESRDGVEHIVITSFTLPPDIVMNRVLYPADEVKSSFHTLERKLAPVEHPEFGGQFISATDPIAINNFYGGAWNENVEQMEDGRIKVDKVVNVQEARKTDRGKRLLDRINGIESGEDKRPIHTSVGVFVEVEEVNEPKTNAAGDEYEWIARNMVFDHDAILLDSIGAATPAKGVGIGVNSKGDRFAVEYASLTDDDDQTVTARDMRTNENMSFSEIHRKLHDELNGDEELENRSWIVDVYDDFFIYETSTGEMFKSGYTIDDNQNLRIQDTRLPVERVIEYRAINQPEEDLTMRDKIIAKLKELGISVNTEISDEELQAKYEEALIANHGDDGNADQPTTNSDSGELAKTVADQANKIADLTSRIEANKTAEIENKIKTIKACSKYKHLSDSVLKTIAANSTEEFDNMYTDSIPSVGIGSTTSPSGDKGLGEQFAVNTDVADLPE